MFNDVFLLQHSDELRIYDYFSREPLACVNLGEFVEIEPYGEYVTISGVLKKDSMTKKLYLCDRNDFICDVEYQMVYEKVCVHKNN